MHVFLHAANDAVSERKMTQRCENKVFVRIQLQAFQGNTGSDAPCGQALELGDNLK